jgi:hypothetical protein
MRIWHLVWCHFPPSLVVVRLQTEQIAAEVVAAAGATGLVDEPAKQSWPAHPPVQPHVKRWSLVRGDTSEDAWNTLQRMLLEAPPLEEE